MKTFIFATAMMLASAGATYAQRDTTAHRLADVVVTGTGAITWLPDLSDWAHSIADLLVPGGTLWFEIYEEYAEETCRLLRERGFSDAEWVADANGKPRIVWCRR